MKGGLSQSPSVISLHDQSRLPAGGRDSSLANPNNRKSSKDSYKKQLVRGSQNPSAEEIDEYSDEITKVTQQINGSNSKSNKKVKPGHLLE